MSRSALDGVRVAMLTVGGSGFAPVASGTWGSAAALVPFTLYWLILVQSGAPALAIEVGLLAGLVVACVFSIAWGDWAIARFGRKDPGQFVLDEAAGQYLALLFMPWSLSDDLFTVGAVLFTQFFWFRLFDVLKPPPARQLEALPAGWGILVDDLFAGLYANIVGQVIWRVSPLAAWLGLSVGGAPA
jgi:phosphatidylglycerophosphatase A